MVARISHQQSEHPKQHLASLSQCVTLETDTLGERRGRGLRTRDPSLAKKDEEARLGQIVVEHLEDSRRRKDPSRRLEELLKPLRKKNGVHLKNPDMSRGCFLESTTWDAIETTMDLFLERYPEHEGKISLSILKYEMGTPVRKVDPILACLFMQMMLGAKKGKREGLGCYLRSLQFKALQTRSSVVLFDLKELPFFEGLIKIFILWIEEAWQDRQLLALELMLSTLSKLLPKELPSFPQLERSFSELLALIAGGERKKRRAKPDEIEALTRRESEAVETSRKRKGGRSVQDIKNDVSEIAFEFLKSIPKEAQADVLETTSTIQASLTPRLSLDASGPPPLPPPPPPTITLQAPLTFTSIGPTSQSVSLAEWNPTICQALPRSLPTPLPASASLHPISQSITSHPTSTLSIPHGNEIANDVGIKDKDIERAPSPRQKVTIVEKSLRTVHNGGALVPVSKRIIVLHKPKEREQMTEAEIHRLASKERAKAMMMASSTDKPAPPKLMPSKAPPPPSTRIQVTLGPVKRAFESTEPPPPLKKIRVMDLGQSTSIVIVNPPSSSTPVTRDPRGDGKWLKVWSIMSVAVSNIAQSESDLLHLEATLRRRYDQEKLLLIHKDQAKGNEELQHTQLRNQLKKEKKDGNDLIMKPNAEGKHWPSRPLWSSTHPPLRPPDVKKDRHVSDEEELKRMEAKVKNEDEVDVARKLVQSGVELSRKVGRGPRSILFESSLGCEVMPCGRTSTSGATQRQRMWEQGVRVCGLCDLIGREEEINDEEGVSAQQLMKHYCKVASWWLLKDPFMPILPSPAHHAPNPTPLPPPLNLPPPSTRPETLPQPFLGPPPLPQPSTRLLQQPSRILLDPSKVERPIDPRISRADPQGSFLPPSTLFLPIRVLPR